MHFSALGFRRLMDEWVGQRGRNAQIEVTKNLAQYFLNLCSHAQARMILMEGLLEKCTHARPEAGRARRWLRTSRFKVEYANAEVKKLNVAFAKSYSDTGTFPGGEAMPIQFEIAQKLHDLILSQRELFLDPDRDTELNDDHIQEIATWGVRWRDTYGAPEKSIGEVAKREAAEIKLLGRSEELEKSLRDYVSLAVRPEGRANFEKIAKWLLVDECAHAEWYLKTGLEMSGKIGAPDLSAKILALRNDLKIYSDTNLKRVIDGVRQDPTRFAVLRYYRIETLQRQLDTLSGKIEPAWQGFFRKVADHLVSYRAAEGYDRIFLTPTSRFLIQLLLTVARNPGKMLDELKADDGQVVSSDFKSRRTIIANRFDPLDKTVRGFGIKRFLTTNYDFEVERFFQDIGYRRLEHESDIEDSFVGPGRFDRGDYRVDGLGGSFRDLTFKAETASDLITFAIGNDNTDAAVYHLHGRATIDDPLVITERNYMDMYIRDDPQRVLVNESITMAFASAPILFLGLGMDESDVLRPLRQFMSDRDRSMGYTGMVLMPADKHIDARSKFASSLYLRYGVHTIFYGSGTMEITTLDDPPREVALDWLHRITALIIALDKSAKRIEDNISKELEAVKDDSEYATEANTRKLVLSKIGDVLKAEEGEALFSKLKKAVGKLGGDLAIDGNTEDSCALGLLFGKLESTGKFSLAELRAAGEIKSCKLTSQRPLKTGTGPLKPNRQNSYPLADYVNFYLDMLSDVMHMSLDGFNRRASLLGIRRSLAARRATLDGVRNALLTATMNAAMEALEKEWRAWRIDWQTSPPHRRPLIEELPFRPSAPEAKMILPRRYVRHQVINAISNMEKAESSFCSSLDDPISSKFCNSSPTNIRSFDTWISALHAQRTKDMEALSPNANANQRGLLGRRMNTVAAQTGVGKGTFFSVFSTKLGLSSYIEAVYPHSTHYKNNPRPIFAAAFFLNFSFSTELASIYDMVREKLLDIVSWQNAIIMLLDKSSGMAIKSVEEHLPKLIALGPDHAFSQTKELIEAQNAWRAKFILDHRKLSRAAVLDILFKKFTNTSVGIADLTLQLNQQIIPRILICLNACELLFRPDRIPKNVEIADMLLSLGSDRTKKPAN